MSVFYNETRKTWYIRVTIDKKRFYCYKAEQGSGCFKTKKSALSFEPLFIASILGEKQKEALIVNNDYLEGFYQFMRSRLKPSTFYGYKNTFEKYWKRLFYGLDVSTISNTTLETYSAKVFKSPHNHQGKSASGKLFVRYLKRTKPDLDIENIAAPKKSEPDVHEYHIYSESEFQRFISAVDDERERFLFLILFHYGLRISECLALRWSDFKEDGLHIERTACVKNELGTIIFTSPKTTNSYRVYPLIDILKPYVEDFRLHTGPYVFPGSHGNDVMGQSNVRRKSVYYAKKAGVKVIRLHEFRHSCVSNLLMHGLPPRLVARWVGDTESMILRTYSHLLPSEKQTIADFINQSKAIKDTHAIDPGAPLESRK